MKVRTFEDKRALGQAAADDAAAAMQAAINKRGTARIVATTGASQFEFLDALTRARTIDWAKVEMFHLDEYVGLPETHPASLRRYLRERLIDRTGLWRYHLLDGNADLARVTGEVGSALVAAPIDVAFVGIGENAHLAFNDPPADFESESPYLVVELDAACRRQQVGEGWFASLDDVPSRAITMSIRQILKAREILCIVPDARKAPAVKACLQGPITPQAPASILRTHPRATIYLDRNSVALVSPDIVRRGTA